MPMAKQSIKLCQKVTYYNAEFLCPKFVTLQSLIISRMIFNICYLGLGLDIAIFMKKLLMLDNSISFRF